MNGGPLFVRTPAISAKLGTASVAASGMALLVAMIALTSLQYLNLRNDFIGDSDVEARILANNVIEAVAAGRADAATVTLQTMHNSDSFNYAAVVLPDGRVFAVAPATASPAWSSLAPGHRFNWTDFEVVAPIEHGGQPIGYLYLNKTLANMHRQTAVYAANCLAVFLGTFSLTWLLTARARKAIAASEQSLHQLAHIDSVTQTWNRHAFNEHLQSLASAAQGRIAVLLVDLDNFKAINDTFGHHTGDRLLKKVAGRLQGALEPGDSLFRLGGDEFAVVVTSRHDRLPADEVAADAARLLATPFALDGREMYVTCSIGMSIYPDDADDVHTVIRNADLAMYKAKALGKNTCQTFSPDLADCSERRLLVGNALRKAIARNEFCVHYQPQFCLASLNLTGAEALLRWHSPELGAVSPAEFIPVAEECGLIAAIGDSVLETVCAQIAEWRRRDFFVPTVSINISARQLRHADFAGHVLAVLDRHDVPPDRLELELTESMLMENVCDSARQFETLQARGVRLSVDDFGTGYSSMAYLKRLPLDKIKIDRTFVADLPESENDRQIVAAIIAMSHSLGLTVVAEGVENPHQAELLGALGCDAVQGYLYGRPAAAEAFAALLMPKPQPRSTASAF